MQFLPINSSPISIMQAREINTLVLAFVGDSVHSLYIKTRLASSSTSKIKVLHTKSSQHLKATTQAQKMQTCLELLNEEEKDIYMRTRNSHVNTVAKSASLVEYKQATCYEALLGYLYLTGQSDRLAIMLEVGIDKE